MTLTPPPFDPELAAALAIVAEHVRLRPTSEEIIGAGRFATREQLNLAPPDEELAGNDMRIEEHLAPGPAGAPGVPLLILRPIAPATGGPLPIFYYVHGGGLVAGTNRVGVRVAVEWARALAATVVSVDYRLAPEHPYPAQVEDVYAGLLWTAEHAGELGGDPERIVIAGTSAGAGLTAGLALLLRDRGGPRPAGQVLMFPMLDDRADSPSARQMAGRGFWDRVSVEAGWTALLGTSRGGPGVPAYAAPARADDLSGLPPAFIDVGSAETFRDEAVGYASRIWQAGGQAELHVWPGGYHSFDFLAPQAAISRDATAARLKWLRRLLGE